MVREKESQERSQLAFGPADTPRFPGTEGAENPSTFASLYFARVNSGRLDPYNL